MRRVNVQILLLLGFSTGLISSVSAGNTGTLLYPTYHQSYAQYAYPSYYPSYYPTKPQVIQQVPAKPLTITKPQLVVSNHYPSYYPSKPVSVSKPVYAGYNPFAQPIYSPAILTPQLGLIKPPGQSQPPPQSPPLQQAEPVRNPSYGFIYEVKGGPDGGHFGHTEKREGQTTTGKYFVRLPDGRLQTVSYIADEFGFRPQITYGGHIIPDFPR